MTQRSGIPDDLTIDAAREWVSPRVSERRFSHVEGVALVARELAEKTGADPFLAELGGWLHDACKEVKDTELVARARELGLELHPIEEANGHLLHGPVGALTAAAELALTNRELIDAIAEHTLGALNMTELSQILFLADCLEESRPHDFTVPIWQALGYKLKGDDPAKRRLDSKPDTEAGILIACDLCLEYLIEDKKVIHPKTVEVRNYYLNRVKSRARPK